MGEVSEGFVGGEFVADDAGVELVDESAPLGAVDGDVVGGLHYVNNHLGGFVAVAGKEELELVGIQALGGDVGDALGVAIKGGAMAITSAVVRISKPRS